MIMNFTCNQLSNVVLLMLDLILCTTHFQTSYQTTPSSSSLDFFSLKNPCFKAKKQHLKLLFESKSIGVCRILQKQCILEYPLFGEFKQHSLYTRCNFPSLQLHTKHANTLNRITTTTTTQSQTNRDQLKSQTEHKDKNFERKSIRHVCVGSSKSSASWKIPTLEHPSNIAYIYNVFFHAQQHILLIEQQQQLL